MSFKCTICGKGPSAGKTVSHSNMRTNRVFNPNLQKQRIVVDGVTKRELVCMKCLKKPGTIVRPA
ncbi:MAG: 50S ribosomal protein L28 [Endomicrobiales bacterium]|nr:50S ribosomal protein L28 [Endomicrobiales bacterium]